MTPMIRSYSELRRLTTFEERFNYLKLDGSVGEDTFGFDRVFNQRFYSSREWKERRDKILLRDHGCDLGIQGHEIPREAKYFIHHMNPISLQDLEKRTELLLNPDFLITTLFTTHNAIHYGDEHLLAKDPVERRMNDTCPWKEHQRRT